jgi:hypothetical protein
VTEMLEKRALASAERLIKARNLMLQIIGTSSEVTMAMGEAADILTEIVTHKMIELHR